MYDSSAIQVLKGFDAVRRKRINFFIEDILNEVVDRGLNSFAGEYVNVSRKEKAFTSSWSRVVTMKYLDACSEKMILSYSTVIGSESPLTITELLKASRRLARCPPFFDMFYL